MSRDYPQYWLCGKRPVKFEETLAGGLRITVFEEETGESRPDSRYFSLCFYDREGLARQITREEWEAVVIARGGQP